jgi:uncharacterized ferritin-like protein (DUF455 family)
MIAMSEGRQLGGAFLPEENARRLSVFRFVETALMRTMSGWIARVPELDVKIELARQVAFGAERADELWKRTSQLLWPEDRDVVLPPRVVALLRQLDEGSAGTAALLGGIGLVAHRLAGAYREHAGATDQVTDAPTVRLLGRLADDVRALGDWAGSRATAMADDHAPSPAWSLDGHLIEAGDAWVTPAGADGQSMQAELARVPAGREAVVEIVARDARFRDLGPAETPPPEPLDTPPGRLAYLLRTLNYELFAAELMGRNLYEHGPRLPWQFTMDMARQCWDEARHAEIMIRRIEATGVPWQPGEEGFSPYPLDNGPWRDVYPGDLFERLVAMNRGIEGLALDTHLYRSDTFAGLGDDVAAATHLYIVADEAPHVGFGTRWLRYLLFKDTQPRQADLALIPFFPVLGQRFAPGHDAAGQDELQHFKEAETAAWERIAERRAARLSAEGRVDFAAGDGTPTLDPSVLGVRRRDAVNRLARRLAGFTSEEIDAAVVAAGGRVAVADD